jgi:predicted transcriptional regulator of viral defense system
MNTVSRKVRGEKRKKIYEIIKKAEEISLKDIRASTDINYNTIRGAVIALTNEGLIKRVKRGAYKAQ